MISRFFASIFFFFSNFDWRWSMVHQPCIQQAPAFTPTSNSCLVCPSSQRQFRCRNHRVAVQIEICWAQSNMHIRYGKIDWRDPFRSSMRRSCARASRPFQTIQTDHNCPPSLRQASTDEEHARYNLVRSPGTWDTRRQVSGHTVRRGPFRREWLRWTGRAGPRFNAQGHPLSPVAMSLCVGRGHSAKWRLSLIGFPFAVFRAPSPVPGPTVQRAPEALQGGRPFIS